MGCGNSIWVSIPKRYIRDSQIFSTTLQHDKGECSQYDKMVSHSEGCKSKESHLLCHSEALAEESKSIESTIALKDSSFATQDSSFATQIQNDGDISPNAQHDRIRHSEGCKSKESHLLCHSEALAEESHNKRCFGFAST